MTWTVTMKTNESTWSVVRDIRANDYTDAIVIARQLVGGTFVSVE